MLQINRSETKKKNSQNKVKEQNSIIIKVKGLFAPQAHGI